MSFVYIGGIRIVKIELINICKKFGKKEALRDISFNIEEGINGLIGANGAGKTTLIRLLIDYYKPSSGKLILHDDVGSNYDSKRNLNFKEIIGYLPQYFEGISYFTVDEFIDYIALLKNMDLKDTKSRKKELIEIFSLTEFSNKKLKNLSGGTLRRVGIVQALINNPKILILDEPSAGLDPRERIILKNFLNNYAEDKIVILSSHIISDVEDISKNIFMLNNGELILSSNIEDLQLKEGYNSWKVKLNYEEYNKALKQYIIRNAKEIDEGIYEVRILSKLKPYENAISVRPSLEDIYLSYYQ